MVGDDAVGHDVLLYLGIGVAHHLLHALDDGSKQVGLVVGVHVLEHSDQPLESSTGVHVFGRQRVQGAIGVLVVLDEHQVP